MDRREWLVVVVFYLGMSLPMFAKTTFYAALPILQKETDMSMAQQLNMMSLAAISHCVFKLICGAVVDTYGAKTVWSSSLAICALCLLCIATIFADFPSLVVIAWVTYRGFHSFCWPAMIAALGTRFEGSGFTTALGFLTTSTRVGGVVGGFLASICLSWHAGWRKALAISAGALLIEAVTLAALPAPVKNEDADASIADRTANADNKLVAKTNTFQRHPPLTEVLRTVCSSKRLRFYVLFAMLTYPTSCLQDLFPSYFVAQGMSAADAARVTSGCPLGMAVALPLAGYFTGRYPKMGTVLLGLSMSIAGVLMFVLANLDLSPPIDTAIDTAIDTTDNGHLAQALLFALGFCFAPAYYLPPNIFACAYGGEHKALLVSILDFTGYATITVFTIAVPYLVSSVGWAGVMQLNAVLVLISSLVISYLMWWQLVEPVKALVTSARATHTA